MKLVKYPLFEKRFINRWLVTDVSEKYVPFKKVTLSGDINIWLKQGFSVHENPCRKQYVNDRRKFLSKYPKPTQIIANSNLNFEGHKYVFSPYFPWDDTALDISGCWDIPTQIDAFATTTIIANEDEIASFVFEVCGGLTCWCNDKLVLNMTPYTRNILAKQKVNLALKKGKNTIFVHLNDLAERDCTFMLKVEYCGKQNLQQCIATDDTTDTAQLLKCEKILEDLCFEKNNFTEDEINVLSKNDTLSEQILHYKCATEENEISGVYNNDKVILPKGKAKILLCKAGNLPIGYLRFYFSIFVNNIRIYRLISAENHPIKLLQTPVCNIEMRKKYALKTIAEYGEVNANRALALLIEGKDIPFANDLLLKQIEKINNRHDCSDFYLVYFPYIFKRFENTKLLYNNTAKEMKACILNFRYWMDELGNDVMWFYSENHALLFHTCQLLAAEIFTGEVFTNSGLTGVLLEEKALRLLDNWFTSFFSEGFTEWNSSAYLPIDMLGLASLYAFSKNQKIRNLAKKGMDFIYLLLAQNSTNGILACSSGRTYPKELFGNLSNCTGAISYIGFGVGSISHAAKGIVSLCISDYQPPQEYHQFTEISRENAMEIFSTHGYQKHVNTYTYKTNSFIASAAIDFKPGKSGYQEHPFHLAFNANAQIFINHPGEYALFGEGRPSYWAGNASLPQVHSYKDLSVIMYNIDSSYSVDFTHLYLPILQFDIVEKYKNTLIIKKDNGYAAIYCSCPLTKTVKGPNSNREFIAKAKKSIWLVKTGTKEQYKSFTNFKASVKLSSFTVYLDELTLLFYDNLYGEVRDSFGGCLSVNSKNIIFPDTNQYGIVKKFNLKENSNEQS